MVGRRRELVSLVLATMLAATAMVGIVVKDDTAATGASVTSGSDDMALPSVRDDAATPLPGIGDAPSDAPGSGRTGGSVSAPSSSQASGGALPAKPASGPPIRVGVHLGDNESSAARFGVGGLPEIGQDEIDAIIKQVNADGGLAGRKITPVYHRTDPLNGSFDSQGQRACEALIVDGHVELLVDNALTPSKVLMDCAAAKHVPLVWELHMVKITNAESTKLADLLYRPSMPNAERLGIVPDGLFGAGFFKNAKVGLIRYDEPESKLISQKVFRPRLAAHHVPVVSEYVVSYPSGSTSAAPMSSESSSAVLQFKNDGVTHVLFVPSGGAIPLVFLPAAASQGWSPKYGLSTQDAPTFIAENFAGPQLEGSMAVGWVPNIDGDPSPLKGASFDHCRAALSASGLTWDPDVEPYCDAFYFLHRALRGASSVTRSALRAGAEAIGTSMQSPYVFGTRFVPGHHDGPSQARVLRYQPDVSQYRYTGPLLAF